MNHSTPQYPQPQYVPYRQYSVTPGKLILGQKGTTKTILWDIITDRITFILGIHVNQPLNLEIDQIVNIKPGDPISQANPRTTVTSFKAMIYKNNNTLCQTNWLTKLFLF